MLTLPLIRLAMVKKAVCSNDMKVIIDITQLFFSILSLSLSLTISLSLCVGVPLQFIEVFLFKAAFLLGGQMHEKWKLTKAIRRLYNMDCRIENQ